MQDDIDILYRRFGGMVFRRCQMLLGNEDDAIDATHNVFARLIARGALEIDTPSSYLYVAATRECLNFIRSRKRKPSGEPSLLESIAALDEERRSVARDLLAKLFNSAPELTGVIAVLHHVDGLTLEQTAQEVGLSVSGVRRRLRSLRTMLTEMEQL